MRWNHWLRVDVVWPLEALVWFGLICFMKSHIHAWNMAWGWFAEKRIGSGQSMVGSYVEVVDLFGFSYVNKSPFSLLFS